MRKVEDEVARAVAVGVQVYARVLRFGDQAGKHYGGAQT